MPKLVISEGGQQSVFELFDDEATLGRGAANEIQVVDSRASKQHAVVRRVAGRMKLVDLESKNGTRVNGEFRNQRWLETGDVVTIGDLTMTYDGSDAVAARPAVTLSAAVQAAPVAPAAPAAPRPRAASRAGGGARTGARRGRDEEDEDEERPRGPARRKDNSASVAMLVGGGVLAVIALLFFLLSHSGAGKNAQAIQEAKRLSRMGKLDEAIAYLERNSDPSQADEYVSVREQLDAWKKQAAGQSETDRENKASAVYNQINRDRIEQWKNHQTDEQLGKRLLEFVETYKGTLQCTDLLKSPYEPHTRMRALLEKVGGGK